jgi:FkbM family methyltransferase
MLRRMFRSLRFRYNHLFRQSARFLQLRNVLGAGSAIRYLRLEEKLQIRSDGTLFLTSKYSNHPLMVRPGSSDLYVFNQVFVALEYSFVPNIPPDGLIIDAGANVGYTSCYFLSRFPDCRIIAIEPDSSNVKALRANLLPYGDRATVIQAALWSQDTELSFAKAPYRDGREWSRQVAARTAENGLVQCRGIALPSLISRFKLGRIDLLKVDIEGAEGEVFRSLTQEWLGITDCIAIEIHNDSEFGDCEAIFHAAVSTQEFEKHHAGELTICRRRSLPN